MTVRAREGSARLHKAALPAEYRHRIAVPNAVTPQPGPGTRVFSRGPSTICCQFSARIYSADFPVRTQRPLIVRNSANVRSPQMMNYEVRLELWHAKHPAPWHVPKPG